MAAPADKEPRHELACLYLDSQRLAQATATARDTLRDCGEDVVSYAVLSDALMRQERHAEAVDPLSRGQAAQDTPEMEQWMRASLGIALARIGHRADALELFSCLREPSSSDPLVQHWREQADRTSS